MTASKLRQIKKALDRVSDLYHNLMWYETDEVLAVHEDDIQAVMHDFHDAQQIVEEMIERLQTDEIDMLYSAPSPVPDAQKRLL